MQTLTRKSLKLKACPRCGGDVCRMRDTFGVYHQCAQCGREIRQVAASPVPAATLATVDMPSNTTDHREKITA